jgi:gamma-glutamylcyclotransferase (GGCT)/AIG2-like uncharacterized protein YtfP
MENMIQRCPRATPISAAELLDWKLMFCHHATVVPESGHRVPGALWKITAECEAALDRYEGYPVYYTKRFVDLEGHQVMFYEMVPSDSSAPSPGYFQQLLQGYEDWQLPKDILYQALEHEKSSY